MENLADRINSLRNLLGNNSVIVEKNIFIGKISPVNAAIIYINGLANKNMLERDVLNPLMLHIDENLNGKENLMEILCSEYITASNAYIENNFYNVPQYIKRGKTAVLVDNIEEIIIIDTTGGEFRPISEPTNETTVRGSREGFVENLEVNISILRRRIKDKNLVIKNFIVGRRSQTDVVLVYLEDVADKNVVNEIVKRIELVDVDAITGSGQLQQYISNQDYSLFPEMAGSERSDVVVGNLMEGRVAVIVSGTPYVLCAPAIFTQFFQATEDYNQATVLSTFTRIVRFLAALIVIFLPSIYLTLIKFNSELIPIKFIVPIIQSRTGIALTPFLEIILMEIIIEFLREGGLRLPTKIAQTVSVVGGIIIGDTAIKSKIVSPFTLLVVGVTVVATFLIPNYEMALVIRILRFPMLILANTMGIFGITIGFFFTISYLSSIYSFGVPYFDFKKSDVKDTFIRAPLWKMNKRPEGIPNRNNIRQTDFRYKFKRNKNNE